MNKKLTAIILSALTLGALSVSAQTPAPAAPSPTWTFTPSFASQYMFRGVRLGGPSFQPNIEMGYGALAVGIWTNFPMKDKVAGQSDPEIDPYVTYTVTLSPTLSLTPAATIYTYPNATKSNGFYKATFEPSIALNWTPVAGLKIAPKLYYDTILSMTTAELNAYYSVPLPDIGTELSFAATGGTFLADDYAESTSPAIKNWGNYWLLGVSMPFQVVKDTQKLIVGLAYTKGSDNYLKQQGSPKIVNTAAVGRGVVTVSYAISF